MFWYHFVHHFTANRDAMPKGEAESIREAALARVRERWAAGRGDTPLLFDDLIERIERALMPA